MAGPSLVGEILRDPPSHDPSGTGKPSIYGVHVVALAILWRAGVSVLGKNGRLGDYASGKT